MPNKMSKHFEMIYVCVLESYILKVVVATNAVFFFFLVDTGEVKCVSGRVPAKVGTRAGFEHMVLEAFLSFCLKSFSPCSEQFTRLAHHPGKEHNRTQLPISYPDGDPSTPTRLTAGQGAELCGA